MDPAVILSVGKFLIILLILLFILLFAIVGFTYYKYLKVKPKKYIYEENFLTQYDFQALLKELENYNELLDKSKETSNNLVRYNLVLDKNGNSTDMDTTNPITAMLKKYEQSIRKLTNNHSLYLAKNFPIEYRKYEKGSFMKKHRDTLIYKIPQYECVLTLSNTTDSVTMMEDTPVKAAVNSLIIVKAGGLEHEVTKVNIGERKFIKFIYTETDELA